MVKQRISQCPIANTLDLVGDRWSLVIVRELLQGRSRFQDLQDHVEGITSAVLSKRLKSFEAAGLVTRHFYSDHPPRAEYRLTEKGLALGGVVGALGVWGSRYGETSGEMLHTECGEPIAMQFVCPTCDTSVWPGEITSTYLAQRGKNSG